MGVYIGDVPTFKHVSLDKPQAIKILEESSEVVDAFKAYYETRQTDWTEPDNVTDYQMARQHLLDECADVFQATSNLLSAVGVVDMTETIARCKAKNERRGYEYERDLEPSVQKCSDDTQSFTEVGKTSSSSSQSDGTDSREKLEADVYRAADEIDRFYCGEKFINTHKVIRWLDRQAAITERECRQREYAEGDVYRKVYTKSHIDEMIRDSKRELELQRERNTELIAERDQLTNAINELQKKQPYCYNPEQPLDTLNTIGRYIDEQKSQIHNLVKDLVRVSDKRNNLEVNNRQLHTLAGEQAATIDELQASLDTTKRAIAKAGGTWTEHEDGTVAVVFAPDMNKLKAERNVWRNAAGNAHEAWEEAVSERDAWRDKFGKALDFAHEIARLSE